MADLAQVTEHIRGAVGDPAHWTETTGIVPQSLAQNLQSMPATVMFSPAAPGWRRGCFPGSTRPRRSWNMSGPSRPTRCTVWICWRWNRRIADW